MHLICRLVGPLRTKVIGWSTCIFAFLSLGVILQGAALASTHSEFEFQVGHWVGNPQLSSSGEIKSCLLSKHNDFEELLIIRLDNENQLTLGVFEKEWSDEPPDSTNSIVMVDHQVLYFGNGIFHSNTALVVELDNPTSDLNAIAGGKFLSVSALGLTTAFDLKNADEAIAYLRNCTSIRGLPLGYTPDPKNGHWNTL